MGTALLLYIFFYLLINHNRYYILYMCLHFVFYNFLLELNYNLDNFVIFYNQYYMMYIQIFLLIWFVRDNLELLLEEELQHK